MPGTSHAFEQLHEKVKRWIWEQGWEHLREAQEEAVQPALGRATDILIASPTASGKTEAAFLPALSSIADEDVGGVRVLYISPLKALINDQYRRLEGLSDVLNIPVTSWHGDANQTRKQKLLKEPKGVVLITPESLEAIFVNRGTQIHRIFGNLAYLIIDELHAFIGSERGKQLQSLMHRLDLVVHRRVPRIGLSATLGDLSLARAFLRPGEVFPCAVISSEAKQGLRLQVRGYLASQPILSSKEMQAVFNEGREVALEDQLTGDYLQIADDIYRLLRGESHLVFANAKRSVELYADLLRRRSEKDLVPNEFFPHHGNLSKELREELEGRLQHRELPTTAICTSTLEMGVDIGQVESVAQIGPPPAVAGLRQRLGRSGRRGNQAVLRIFVQERELSDKSNLMDMLRTNLFQTVAMVELLLKRWYEPPVMGKLHFSTLIQQVLSLLAQHGGAKAADAYRVLCGPEAAFSNVTSQMFAQLLRGMGGAGLIQQDHDATLVLAEGGERLVNDFHFYAAFNAPEEFRLVHGSRTIGTLPVDSPLVPGGYVIFAGRRWEIVDIDPQERVIQIKPSGGGIVPLFGGKGGLVDDEVRAEMRRLYISTGMPSYLDAQAQELMNSGRNTFSQFGMAQSHLVSQGADTWIIPWRGDRVLNTIFLELFVRDIDVAQQGVGIVANKMPVQDLITHLKDVQNIGPVNAIDLAARVPAKETEKYDPFLPDELLNADYAARSLDPIGAHATVKQMVS